MKAKTLHITNGDCFNDYFRARHDGVALPFREVMMDGDVTAPIFSKAFVSLRAAFHGVSEDTYRDGIAFCNLLASGDYPAVHLWFGKDTFCQLNLLCILAYLEQIAYTGEITLHYIDDHTYQVLHANIPVRLGIYQTAYKVALVDHRMPLQTGVLVPLALMHYLDYLSEDGTLAHLIRKNSNLGKDALLRLLIDKTADYGLSQEQCERLIAKYRNK